MNKATSSDTTAQPTSAQSPVEEYIENVAVHMLEAMDAMFSAISKLSGADFTVGALAEHGRYVAQMVSSELDCLRSAMETARTGAAAPTDEKPAKQ